jgi:hypothetical protein
MLYTLSRSKLTLTYNSLILREFPNELVPGLDKYNAINDVKEVRNDSSEHQQYYGQVFEFHKPLLRAITIPFKPATDTTLAQ